MFPCSTLIILDHSPSLLHPWKVTSFESHLLEIILADSLTSHLFTTIYSLVISEKEKSSPWELSPRSLSGSKSKVWFSLIKHQEFHRPLTADKFVYMHDGTEEKKKKRPLSNHLWGQTNTKTLFLLPNILICQPTGAKTVGFCCCWFVLLFFSCCCSFLPTTALAPLYSWPPRRSTEINHHRTGPSFS